MNVNNRTLFIADNLDIMRWIDSDCIDLIYLDPPFNTKRQYKAPNIHQIILAAEHTSDHSMMIYLMAMGIRLIEMKRILKTEGSIYLHCDPTASHYLKLIMDGLFDKDNFRNEIVWCYRGGWRS